MSQFLFLWRLSGLDEGCAGCRWFAYFLSSGVAPSILLRTSRNKFDNLSGPISSLGFSGPKTSITAA